MSKFVHHASYYLDDKDLSDLFEAQNVPSRFLLRFARRRGLFLSEKASKEELVHALCMAPISWDEVNAIAEAINTEDRDSRQMTKRLAGDIDFEAVPSALERVKAWLEGKGEVPTLTKIGESSYKLECRFVEVQPQRTRPLQRVERQVTIEVEIVDGRVDLRYSEHEHARAIVRRLADEIPSRATTAKSERSVSLRSVRDPQTRIRFFTELINGIEGFFLSGVSDLHLDRRFPEENETDRHDAEEVGTNKRKKELEGLVKHAVLFGDSLLKSEFYLELRDSGYYIGSVKWTANELGGDQRQVEFYAGFKDPIEANDFLFDVRKVAKRDKAGDYGKGERPHALERPVMLKLVEVAAYQAMEAIEQEVEVDTTRSVFAP
jgi:hypothetical protein